jgi:chromosome segregation ATPase
MTKRKTMGDQVAEQAVEINNLRDQLAQCKADFQVLEATHDRLCQDTGHLKESWKSSQEALSLRVDEVVSLQEEVGKLRKELESSKSSYTYKSKQCDVAEAEIEQAHAALDILPEAPPKEYEKEYGKGKHTLSARIMGTLLAVARAAK